MRTSKCIDDTPELYSGHHIGCWCRNKKNTNNRPKAIFIELLKSSCPRGFIESPRITKKEKDGEDEKD